MNKNWDEYKAESAAFLGRCAQQQIPKQNIEAGQCASQGMQTDMLVKRNTEYILSFEAPLLRAGMTLTVGPVSEQHVVEEARKALEYIRQLV